MSLLLNNSPSAGSQPPSPWLSPPEPITPWTGTTIASVSFACTLYILVYIISERTLNTSFAPIFIPPRIPLGVVGDDSSLLSRPPFSPRSRAFSDGEADTHKLSYQRRACSPPRSESTTSSTRMRSKMDVLAFLEGRGRLGLLGRGAWRWMQI
ncbi:hypothetical protein BKA82DRAFT_4127129, partial [Pisolithus tinctorius]